MLKKLASVLIVSALVLTAPGLEFYRAWAASRPVRPSAALPRAVAAGIPAPSRIAFQNDFSLVRWAGQLFASQNASSSRPAGNKAVLSSSKRLSVMEEGSRNLSSRLGRVSDSQALQEAREVFNPIESSIQFSMALGELQSLPTLNFSTKERTVKEVKKSIRRLQRKNSDPLAVIPLGKIESIADFSERYSNNKQQFESMFFYLLKGFDRELTKALILSFDPRQGSRIIMMLRRWDRLLEKTQESKIARPSDPKRKGRYLKQVRAVFDYMKSTFIHGPMSTKRALTQVVRAHLDQMRRWRTVFPGAGPSKQRKIGPELDPVLDRIEDIFRKVRRGERYQQNFASAFYGKLGKLERRLLRSRSSSGGFALPEMLAGSALVLAGFSSAALLAAAALLAVLVFAAVAFSSAADSVTGHDKKKA